MGKSTAAGMLRRLGVRLFDADAVVHQLLGPGGKAVAADRGRRFPVCATMLARSIGAVLVSACSVIRWRFSVSKRSCIRWCARAETRFVRQARARRESLVVLDIPLLYETGAPERCDYVLVVSASARVQRERVMRRPGMTESRFREHFAGADAGSRKAPACRFRRADRAWARFYVPPVAPGRRRAAPSASRLSAGGMLIAGG